MRGFSVSGLAIAGSLAFTAAIFGATDAHALNPPVPFTSCYTNAGVTEANTTSCAVGGATANVKYDNPTVSATGAGGAINQGFAALDYNFQVVGGDFGTNVVVDIRALLNWTTTGDGVGFAEISINDNQTFHTICSNCGVGGGFNEDPSWNGTLQIATQVGAVGTIHLEVQASAGTFGSASAMADPLLTIDSTTADAGRYSFVFSDGITNGINTTGGVPEPASWALMLLGFGLGGAGLRLRRERALA